MSEECSHDCSSCGEDCESRSQSLFVEPNEKSSIKKVIGIVSGKGGVGKSTVTSLLAVAMNRQGCQVGILDADVTGPSIPKAFGVKKEITGDGTSAYPAKSDSGIDIVSINLLLQNETDPVVWRGPILANVVKQFWHDFIWEDDYLFIDMPPGTGDVPLTVFQSIKVDGIIIVTSPQELVSMIVDKAVKMAEMMHVPILGLVENMSYFECPDCHKKHEIFGKSHIGDIAHEHGLEVLERLPIDSQLAALCDEGKIELVEGDYFEGIEDVLRKLPKRK